MRYIIETHTSGPPPSRWRLFWQQALAWVILIAFAALVVTLAIVFFSAIASLVAALVVVLVIFAAIAAVVLRIKYRRWWPQNRD
jgi:membrane protein YdbS with pleckstrin-like domain